MIRQKLQLEPKDRLIVALDTSDVGMMMRLGRELVPHVDLFKIGLELITAVGGPPALGLVEVFGGKGVFYDGKFNDIPNTVAGAVRAVTQFPQVKMFNVHASAGLEAMKAAVAQKRDALALAVTILTSLGQGDCEGIFGDRLVRKFMIFAHMALAAGMDGLVCSPQEISHIRDGSQSVLSSLTLVTPGVRPEWAAANDQKRIMTPGEAIRAGADYLVVGRPITNPPDGMTPAEAAQRIIAEIAAAS